VFDVVMKVRGLAFEEAKLVVAEAINRLDLIREKSGERFQATDAASLMRPPAGQRATTLCRGPTSPTASRSHRTTS
jgi:hypothetical protein